MLKLKRPLVFFDLETTGVDPATSRIVEIAMIRMLPSSTEEETFYSLVNPQVPIPPATTQIHHIDDEKVKDAPTFKELAPKILDFIEGADLAGYSSSSFDVPLLMQEFHRVGVDFTIEDRHLIDAKIIFYKKEERTLSAAYKKYCGEELELAHSAMADVEATKQVLLGQLKYYQDLPDSVEELSEFCDTTKRVDIAGRLERNAKGEIVFRFGKYKDRSVRSVFQENPSYYEWMMKADFPVSTKRIIQKEYESLTR